MRAGQQQQPDRTKKEDDGGRLKKAKWRNASPLTAEEKEVVEWALDEETGEILRVLPPRKEEGPNVVAAMLRMCLPGTDVRSAVAAVSDRNDNRPGLVVTMGGRNVQALVDTGANLSVMDYDLFTSIFGVPAGNAGPANPTGISVKSVTGDDITVKDYVEVEMIIMGRPTTRPLVLVEGFQNHALVLGCDVIKEERLIIDGETNEIKFKELQVAAATWEIAEVRAKRRTTVLPRSIQHIQVEGRVGSRTLPNGCEGFVENGHRRGLTVWEALNVTGDRGGMVMAVVNTSYKKVNLKGGDLVGFMRPKERDEELRPLTDATLASVFGTTKPDRPDPPRGRIRQLTKEQAKELVDKLHIQCPQSERWRYEKLFMDYNDVCSCYDIECASRQRARSRLMYLAEVGTQECRER